MTGAKRMKRKSKPTCVRCLRAARRRKFILCGSRPAAAFFCACGKWRRSPHLLQKSPRAGPQAAVRGGLFYIREGRSSFQCADGLAARLADVAACIGGYLVCAAAKDACGLVFFQNDPVLIHVYLKGGVLFDVQNAALPGCAALWPPRAQHPRPARRPSSPGPPAGGHIPAEWAAGRPPPSGPPPA